MSGRQTVSKDAVNNLRLCLISVTLCSLLVALRFPVDAQQVTKLPLIGIIEGTEGSIESPGISTFREQLRILGHVERHTITVEYRSAGGNRTRVSVIAAEFVQRKVDIIVTGNTTVIRMIQQVASTIPIVMVGSSDHPALVSSPSSPGANVTGSFVNRELTGKLVEILNEVYPQLRVVGVLWWPGVSGEKTRRVDETERAARALSLRTHSMPVRDPKEIDGAFQSAQRERVNGLVVIRNPLFNTHRKKLIALAKTHRIPAIYMDRRYTADGGLISYGPDGRELWRQAAFYVDKILKGAKPAELPAEQPRKLELVINLAAAQAIGLTVPDSVLRWADEVIN